MSEAFDSVPDNWSVFELGSLGTTFSGLSGKNKDDFGRGKKYIPYMNIYTNPSIDPDWMELVDIRPTENQNRVQFGDMFFTTSSETPDEVGISSVLLTEVGECYLNSFCFGFRPYNFDAFIPEYAQYFFRSELFRQQMYELAQGATRYNLSKKSTLGTMVLLPPLPEQRKIAEILGTWDEAIRLTADLIAAKQQRKKGLMQRLLTGEVRFPGFEGRPRPLVTFQEVLNLQIGRTPSRAQPDYWDAAKKTNNVWLSISDLKGKYVSDSKEYLSDIGVQASRSKLIPVGTVVMSFKLTIGRAAILTVPAYTNEAICALTPKDHQRLVNAYLYHSISVMDFEKDFDQAVKGKTLNTSKLEQLAIPLPDPEEQRRIANTLDLCDHEIDLLQQKLAALQQQKKGLMQRLLTGQIRVAVGEDGAAGSGNAF